MQGASEKATLDKVPNRLTSVRATVQKYAAAALERQGGKIINCIVGLISQLPSPPSPIISAAAGGVHQREQQNEEQPKADDHLGRAGHRGVANTASDVTQLSQRSATRGTHSTPCTPRTPQPPLLDFQNEAYKGQVGETPTLWLKAPIGNSATGEPS